MRRIRFAPSAPSALLQSSSASASARTTLLLTLIALLTPSIFASSADADYILDDSFWNEESPVGEVERLLRDYKQNQEMVRSIGNNYYQIIYPWQLRHHEKMGISTREINNPKGRGGYSGSDVATRGRGRNSKHFHRTSILIKAFTHRFRLDLELNTQLLAPNLLLKHYLINGAEQISKQEIEHCYYHGTVKDYPGATAAFHTCNGVSGVIHIGNETFVIHPFYGGDLTQKHPHVIFEARTKANKGCANAGSNLDWRAKNSRRTKHVSGYAAVDRPYGRNLNYKRWRRSTFVNVTELLYGNVSRSRRDVREATKYIETALVIDQAMFDKRNGTGRAEIVHDAIQVANIADLYFRTLNTRVSLVYVETWQGQNQIQIEKNQDITRALLNFNDYTTRKLFKIEKDTTQLLTGVTFQGNEAGMSVPETICTPKAVGIAVDINLYEPHLHAGIMAHMIGHNLGMGHDDGRDHCYCLDWHGCIMSQAIVGLENVQPYKFSDCSKADYIDALRVGQGLCLLNKPNELVVHRSCGNGILDEGEDCDCGTIEECPKMDPCCDPITCKLTKEAQCASGECCENCVLKPRGIMCREPTNECDLAETCTGTSGVCPLDTYKKNGSPCGSTGRCLAGHCPTISLQCEQIFGYVGTVTEIQCYDQYNKQQQSLPGGHCGKDSSGNFINCETDIYCGTLQCQSGSKNIMGIEDMYANTKITIKGTNYDCRQTLTPQSDVPSSNLIGSCTESIICANQSCASISPFVEMPGDCPSDRRNNECSGHGACSNTNKCHCNPGWSGLDCSIPEAITPPPTVPANAAEPAKPVYNMEKKESQYGNDGSDKHSTVIMVAVLLAVVLSVFVGFAWTAHCSRRKTSSKKNKYDPPYTKKPVAKTFTGDSSNSPEEISIEGSKPHPFNNVTNFSRADSQRVLFRHGNHTGVVGSSNRFQSQSLRKNGICSGSEEDPNQSGEEDAVTFIDVAPNTKIPQKGILKPHGYESKDKWGDDGMSERLDAQSASGRASVSGGAMADVQYKMQDLNGYHEGIIVALKSAAAVRAGSAGVLPGSDDRHDYDYQQQRATSTEKLHDTERRRSRLDEDIDPNLAAPCGPIRIRNLEDLIRQLEHHSSRHMSPSGSEEIRMSETEADRHYRIDPDQSRCRGRMSSGGEEETRLMFPRSAGRTAPTPPRVPSHVPTHFSPHRPTLPPDNDALYESADHNDHRLRDVPDSESDEFIQARRRLARWASEDEVGGGCCPPSPPTTSGSNSDACTTIAMRPRLGPTQASDSEAASSSSTAAHYPEYAH